MKRTHAVALSNMVGSMIVDARQLIASKNGLREIDVINIYEELIRTGETKENRIRIFDLQCLDRLEKQRNKIADYLLAIVED